MKSVYIRAGDLDDAELIFELMRVKKVPFNEAPCRILLEGYGHTMARTRIWSLFKRMSGWGMTSTKSTLITQANAFSDAKDLDG